MSARVLVVDDDEHSLGLVARMLVERGYEVSTATDGLGALAAVEREQPDVMLLDVVMPEMDGMQVLDRIRTQTRCASIPIILMTAKSDDEDVLAGYKYGADYYITKPFTEQELLRGIEQILKAYEPR